MQLVFLKKQNKTKGKGWIEDEGTPYRELQKTANEEERITIIFPE